MDAFLGSVQELQPGLDQGLGRWAASCKWQVLRDAFHKDEPGERTKKRAARDFRSRQSALFTCSIPAVQLEGLQQCGPRV
jgi:hypothetical protein